MALAHCSLGKFLGVVCLCFPPPLDVPTLAARCLYVRKDARDPSSEKWKCGRDCPVILPKFRLPLKCRALLHAANLRHGTDDFTSLSKEGVLRIFFALKIRRLRSGLNPRTWVPKASTLPQHHRSRWLKKKIYYEIIFSIYWLLGKHVLKNSTTFPSNETVLEFFPHVNNESKFRTVLFRLLLGE